MITIITCWYNFRSKFDNKTYSNWIKNFVNYVTNFNLVIYTDINSRQLILDLVPENTRIKIIYKEFDQFHLSKYKDKFIKNHEINHQLKHRVEYKVNMLWCEKVYFVQDALKQNYFESDFYIWCDIGYFRKSTAKNWPNPEKIKTLHKDKIYYNLVYKNSLEKCKRFKKRKKYISHEQESVSGGFFIIYKDLIDTWSTLFEQKLNYYFDNNYTVKDDQTIVVDCIISNIDIYCLIYGNGNWFEFKNFLS